MACSVLYLDVDSIASGELHLVLFLNPLLSLRYTCETHGLTVVLTMLCICAELRYVKFMG